MPTLDCGCEGLDGNRQHIGQVLFCSDLGPPFHDRDLIGCIFRDAPDRTARLTPTVSMFATMRQAGNWVGYKLR